MPYIRLFYPKSALLTIVAISVHQLQWLRKEAAVLLVINFVTFDTSARKTSRNAHGARQSSQNCFENLPEVPRSVGPIKSESLQRRRKAQLELARPPPPRPRRRPGWSFPGLACCPCFRTRTRSRSPCCTRPCRRCRGPPSSCCCSTACALVPIFIPFVPLFTTA